MDRKMRKGWNWHVRANSNFTYIILCPMYVCVCVKWTTHSERKLIGEANGKCKWFDTTDGNDKASDRKKRFDSMTLWTTNMQQWFLVNFATEYRARKLFFWLFNQKYLHFAFKWLSVRWLKTTTTPQICASRPLFGFCLQIFCEITSTSLNRKQSHKSKWMAETTENRKLPMLRLSFSSNHW